LAIDARYDAFSRREESTDLSTTLVLNQTVPLSELMGEPVRMALQDRLAIWR
jgi:hypothetical protein